MQTIGHLQTRTRGRFERLNVVIAILIAGWVPSVLMLIVSYTILTNTLESKILRDRQNFVQLIAHLLSDDLSRTGEIIGYYETYAATGEVFSARYPNLAAQEWLKRVYYSHPRIDGMFITTADGKLIGSIPDDPGTTGHVDVSQSWLEAARKTTGFYVSPIHARVSDQRIVADIVGAVHAPNDTTIGFVGASVLVERIGRRLSAINLADQQSCQVIDQNGNALFDENFRPLKGRIKPANAALVGDIRQSKLGHSKHDEILYSFAPVESSGWTTVVKQPRAVAYAPVRNLLQRTTLLALWLIVATAVIAWLTDKFYKRQREAAARIEREVIFNDKILANMPIGIALVDPISRRFLQANETFSQMARRFGNLPREKELNETTYEQVRIAPPDAIEKVLSFGTPFQLVEQSLTDSANSTSFVNVNLLRLQDSKQTVQGVLFLVEDKTRDVRLRQELISANASKDQFLALLSHELRNPLSPVIAMVAELEARVPKGPEVRQALDIIRRNVELEARLIDDLLDVTRISKGKLQLSFEVSSIHEILHRAYEICREDILQKNLDFEFRLLAQRNFVNGDPARLQQVFWNLIKNGVKFTPESGRIVVETINPADDLIEIRFIDTGIGIEPAKLDKVFNAFEQGQSSITRKFGGLGLGLAISKAMVRAHGGSIGVQSNGLDKGTTFTVTLDTVTPPIEVRRPRTPAAPVQPNGDAVSRRPKGHLLVVDDHEDTCIGMKMLLERRGYRITLAHTAEQAVKKAEQEQFDLLISDIGLPDRSGYELMKELRSKSSLPGIAVSGFGMENDISKARAAGFSEHLTKPVNLERLDEAIRNLLKSVAKYRS